MVKEEKVMLNNMGSVPCSSPQGKKAFLISTTGASKEDNEKMGAFKMMNMSMDMAIFQFSGLEVIKHKYFSSVQYVSDKDRKQMLEELRLIVREKLL